MAHFAQLDEHNNVTAVIVVHDNELSVNGIELEAKGIAFLVLWSNGHPFWKQTSYNASIRKNYAGIGYTYDPDRDAFIPPQPFPSWTLDEQTCQWISPVPFPNDEKQYFWDEPSVSWKEA